MASNYTYNKIDSNTFSRKPTSPTILISTKPVSQSVNLFIAKFLINQRSSLFINFQTRVSPLLRDEFINRHRLKLIRIPRRRSWWWMQVEFIVTPRLRSPLIIYIKKTSFLSFPLLFIPRIDRLHRPDDDSRDERDWFDYLVQGITRSFQFLRREKEREREKGYFEHFVESRRWNEIYSASLTVPFRSILLETKFARYFVIREITVLSDIANFFETFRTRQRLFTLRNSIYPKLKINIFQKITTLCELKNSSDNILTSILANVKILP